MGGGIASKITFCIASTILASALTLPIFATQANNAYADNTANTDTTLKISDDVQLSVTAPTVINYKLEPDGTFICPTDTTIKNNSSFPIATKSWSANILIGTATNKDDFAGSSASNAWWNNVSADGGETSPFNLNTETLYDSWNMAASGQSLNDTQDDTLLLAFDGSMKNIDGSIDYNTGKQLSTITFTFGTDLNQKRPEPQPDPEYGIAFAVYSADDNSLNFYKRDYIPKVDDKFNEKSTTKIYYDIEQIGKENKYNVDYYSDDVPWKNELSVIESVEVIDDGISPLSLASWFENASNLSKVNMTKMDFSKCWTMYSTFRSTGVKTIDLSFWNTSNLKSIRGMFQDCISLDDVIGLDTWDTSSLQFYDDMFYHCLSLRTLDFSNWDLSNSDKWIKSADHQLFAGLSNIEKIKMNNFVLPKDSRGFFKGLNNLITLEGICDLSHVQSITEMFSNCKSLKTIDFLKELNTENITDFSSVFNQCNSLIDINALSYWDTSNVTSLAFIFYGCNSLQDFSPISNWNVSNVKNYNSAFYMCENILNLDFLSNWDITGTTLSHTFSKCSKLNDISGLAKWNIGNVQSLMGLFYCCSSLRDFSPIYNWDVTNVTNMQKTFSNTALYDIDLSHWNVSSLETISEVFKDCINANKIILNNWDLFKLTKFDDAFPDNFHGLSLDYAYPPKKCDYFGSKILSCTNGNLTKLNTSNMTSMYAMFGNYKNSLEQIDVSGWDTSSVTDMSSMFSGTHLTQISGLDTWDTSSVTDMSSMFSGTYNMNSNLTSIDGLSKWNMSNVKSMYQMFAFLPNLLTIDDVSGWDTLNVENMREMFYYDTKLYVDCSKWDAKKANMETGYHGERYNDFFNFEAPNVIVPSCWNSVYE